MKTKLLYLIMPLLAFATIIGCSDDDEWNGKIDLNNLKGTWIIDEINNKDITENEYLVMIFDDSTRTYGARTKNDNGSNSSWLIEKDGFYTHENLITINRTNGILILEVLYLDHNDIKYKIKKHTANGEDINDDKTYSADKIGKDYTDKIVGIWEGNSLTVGYDNDPHRWEFKSDNTFVYSTKVDGKWIVKEDNNGRYYVYGDLLVTEFSNSEITGNSGRTCELWEININNNSTMGWEAERENGKVIEYLMKKQ